MKIDEAIEILKHTPIQVICGDDLEYAKARQLGIDALIRIRYQRLKPTVPHKTPLPGETKDSEER